MKVSIPPRTAGADFCAEVIARKYHRPFRGIYNVCPDNVVVFATDGFDPDSGRAAVAIRQAVEWLTSQGFGPLELGISADSRRWAVVARWPAAARGPGPQAHQERADIMAKATAHFAPLWKERWPRVPVEA